MTMYEPPTRGELSGAGFAFAPFTPTSFLMRSAQVFAKSPAIVDGDLEFTYAEFGARSLALTGVFAGLGIFPGDRVAALCTNSHVMLELHNAVPLRGAVLVSLNIRLAAEELAYIVEHSGAKLIVATYELANVARAIGRNAGVRVVVAGGPSDEYENLLATASPDTVDDIDERQLLAINYTNGTTGSRKAPCITIEAPICRPLEWPTTQA